MAPFRCLLLFLAACASAPPPVEEKPQPAPEPDPVLADVEADRILAEKYAEIARRHVRRSELVQAREAILRAITLQPANEDYRQLQRAVELELGDRSASVKVLAREAALAAEVRREEELVTMRRLLVQAERHRERGQWEQAKRAYERVGFMLRTSRYREDAEFREISGTNRQALENLPDERAEAERRRREEALKELAR